MKGTFGWYDVLVPHGHLYSTAHGFVHMITEFMYMHVQLSVYEAKPGLFTIHGQNVCPRL